MNGSGKGSSQGAGAVIAGLILIGVIAGIVAGQPSIGFLVGTGFGILLALLFYFRQRKS